MIYDPRPQKGKEGKDGTIGERWGWAFPQDQQQIGLVFLPFEEGCQLESNPKISWVYCSLDATLYRHSHCIQLQARANHQDKGKQIPWRDRSTAWRRDKAHNQAHSIRSEILYNLELSSMVGQISLLDQSFGHQGREGVDQDASYEGWEKFSCVELQELAQLHSKQHRWGTYIHSR